MTKIKSTYLALIAVLLSPMAANADPISLDIEVSASDWTLLLGDGSDAPIDPFLLDFSISFDNGTDILPTMSGLTVNSFNLGYALSFAYNSVTDLLVVATTPTSASTCIGTFSSACLFFQNISSVSPNLSHVTQVTPTFNHWQANSRDASLTASVPEPSTFALFGIGLLGMAAIRRRKLI